MNKISVLVFLLSVFVQPAYSVTMGYTTGTEYVKFSERSRIDWVRGAMDGIMAESTYTNISKAEQGTWLGRCIEGLEFEQIKAIFEKELNARPEGWHAPAALSLRGTLAKFCSNRGFKP